MSSLFAAVMLLLYMRAASHCALLCGCAAVLAVQWLHYGCQQRLQGTNCNGCGYYAYHMIKQFVLLCAAAVQACGFTLCPAVWLDKDARAALRLAMK
jgi:hypothetical protein